MKRIAFVFILLLAGSTGWAWDFYGAAGTVASVAAKDLSNVDPTLGRASLDAMSKTTPVNGSGQAMATQDYADQLAAQSSLRYYFTEKDNGVPDYELFATSPTSIETLDTATKTVNTTQTLIDTWISATNTPNLATFVAGVYESQFYYNAAIGNNASVVLRGELWLRTVGGVERFVASSSAQTVTATADGARFMGNFTVVATSSAVTDRIVVRLYGIKTGSNACTIRVRYGGTTEGYFGVPISPRNFVRTDLSNVLASGSIPTYADNAAAITGGMLTGQVYRTSTGVLMVVYTP